MTIVTQARVEPDGWTLAVTYQDQGASAWSDFVLFEGADAANEARELARTQANARVIVHVSDAGFESVDGVAVARPARHYATCALQPKPFRYPDYNVEGQRVVDATSSNSGYPAYAPSTRILGEEPNGDGTRTILLILHRPIAAGAVVSVQFRTGWRAGHVGTQSLPAANQSSYVHEAPAARFVCVPFEAVRDGTVRQLDVLAASIMPEGKSAVAAVRVVSTDGSSRVVSWLALATSTLYDDPLRCWTGQVSMAGLQPGLVSHWLTLYPWFGAARHLTPDGEDPAATADLAALHDGANLDLRGMGGQWWQPMVTAYDPTGTRYGYETLAGQGWRHVCIAVDPAGVTAVPANRAAAEPLCGFGNSRAEARANALAVAPASRPANQMVAIATLARLGRALPAANGAPARASSVDDMEMHFVDGVHQLVSTNFPSGAAPTSHECWFHWHGNGADRCTAQAPASGVMRQGGTKNRITALRHEIGSVVYGGGGNRYWLDRGVGATIPGQSHSIIATGTGLGANNARFCLTGWSCEYDLAQFDNSNDGHVKLARGVAFRSRLACNVVVNSRKTQLGSVVPPLMAMMIQGGSAGLDPATYEDTFWWNNDLRGMNAGGGVFTFSWPVISSVEPQRLTRCVVVGNVCEQYGPAETDAWLFLVGPRVARGNIIEHNTIVGQQPNHNYDNDVFSSAAQTYDLTRRSFFEFNRVANNYIERWSTKGDTFNSGTVGSVRAAAGEPNDAWNNRGRCTMLTGTWQFRFGVLCEGNVHGMRQVNTNTFSYAPENYGLSPRMPPIATAAFGKTSRPEGSLEWPRFRDPRSALDANAVGMGDYVPEAGSPLLAVASTAQVDADSKGRLRTGPAWAAGAFEGEPVAGITLWVAAGRHAVGGTSPAVTVSGALAPAAALIGWNPGLLPVLAAGQAIAPDAATLTWAPGVAPVLTFAFAVPGERTRTRVVAKEIRRRTPEAD